MPPDTQNQRPPLAVPIILIAIGAIFLYANYRPGFDPWLILKTYWPLILIFIGLGKMIDSMRARQNPGAPAGSSIGATVAVVAFIDADFAFSDSYAIPQVNYHIDSGVGQLTISQDDQDTSFGISRNDWNLHFSNDVPLELKVDMGAGHGNFRLRDLLLTRLTVNMGAGQVDVDLTGDRGKDLDADIEGGVGQATIRLPSKVGVVVHASGGLGSINARGLKHDGDEYTNDVYGKTNATIRLKVEGGVGQINLIPEP
jgi:hypothetical protein